MSITLTLDAKISSTRVYSLSTKDKKLSTLYDFSMFVVWREINEIRKERVVIDIRNLNKISLQDSYSMSLQAIVTAAVAECQYIIVIDVNDYFYQ